MTMVRAGNGEARVNVTYGGENGELPDSIPLDATDAQVRAWVTEALRSGGVRGISADARADVSNFVVERFAATADVPIARVMIRPKTGYGA